jgi:hypothetical protein
MSSFHCQRHPSRLPTPRHGAAKGLMRDGVDGRHGRCGSIDHGHTKNQCAATPRPAGHIDDAIMTLALAENLARCANLQIFHDDALNSAQIDPF